MATSSNRPDTVVISNLSPLVEGGKYPTKRVIDETVTIGADIFKDGHDIVVAKVASRKIGTKTWEEEPLISAENDRWEADLSFPKTGVYEVQIAAWADDFLTWLHDFERRLTGDQADFNTEIEEGRVILNSAAIRAAGGRASDDAQAIEDLTTKLMKSKAQDVPGQMNAPATLELLARWPDRRLATISDEPILINVETKLSAFSAWYEFFPRCATGDDSKHSKFRDCLPRLDDAKEMGFNVVYFPPIHPIGEAHRKGKNNTVTAEKGDVGSPWAIGNKDGGHRAIEPALGTTADFVWLLGQARSRGLEIAMDFAIQCSPDHPYVEEHPEWFYRRPDGSIKYAENPPKKYQDIYPLDFHCDEWELLWKELLSVVLYWVDKGVKIFRVDNPHTKPVSFWEWLIAEVHLVDPDIIFLAEAFTRPRMMQTLGKIGFTQSYTYFTWRESAEELREYVTELTQGEMRNYYRANFWPNTPDILPFHLQHATPSAFKIRAALAATLSSSWGIYSGYELCENSPLPGREEYLDSEKYQLVRRDWNKPGNIKAFIARLNEARNSSPALAEYANIEFIDCDNDQLLAFHKWTSDGSDRIIVVANLNPLTKQESNIHLPLESLGIPHGTAFEVEDLIYKETYTWRESTNFVSLDPRTKPVHILKVKTS